MSRHGFLLGALATGCQVLIIRELISSLQGNELFIGIVLCGWLLWGALGAYLGGKIFEELSPLILFCGAAALIPGSVIGARLAPLLFTSTVGERLAFSYASLSSLLVTFLPGLVCGWLFSVVVRRMGGGAKSVGRVYFAEGVGAFVSGVLVSVLTSLGVSTLSTAGIVAGMLLTAALGWRVSRWNRVLLVSAGATFVAAALVTGPVLDRLIDAYKYEPYDLVASFDTPYGHETLLRRNGSRILLTDNAIEDVEGDVQTAENLLLPPLAYVPGARDIVILGQLDLMLSPLLDSLPRLSLTAVDPRPSLRKFMSPANSDGRYRHIQSDPVTYLRTLSSSSYDIVILPFGEGGSYRELRYLANSFLSEARRVLRPGGVLYVMTSYDSDRYVTGQDEQLLSTLRTTLATVFPRVILWPGASTLFLAGDPTLTALPSDTVAERLTFQSYHPQFLEAGYLADRLGAWQMARVDSVSERQCTAHSIELPCLTQLQIARGSQGYSIDRWVAALLAHPGLWGALLLLFAAAVVVPAGVSPSRKRFGLALYFTGGSISLSLELISFYVYQSSAGMLYAHFSLLVGTFMLGLASGTRVAMAIQSKQLASGTLLLLICATLLFAATCLAIGPAWALTYHTIFQFLVAACTGVLFVAATRQFYSDGIANAGAGYALELAGSALASLATMALLVPTLGLHRTLVASIILVAVVLLIDLRSSRGVGIQ